MAYEYRASPRKVWHWHADCKELEQLDDEGRSTGPARLAACRATNDTSTKCQAYPFRTSGPTFHPINSQAQERLGYPTQKPEALLERIIKASTNEGDIVLDPFCGCGTAIAAAQQLNRRWIGIDITHLAINLIKIRLADTFGPDIARPTR